MLNCYVKTSVLFVWLLALMSCNSDNANQTTLLEVNYIRDQIEPTAINIGSIAARPSRRNATLLAVNQINEAGGVLGKNLNVIGLIRVNVENSIELAQDMVDAGVEVVQVSGSSRSKAISEVLSLQQKLVISESATSPSLSDFNDNDFLFRLPPSDVYQGRVLASLASSGGAETAVIVINENDVFGQDLANEFKLNFESEGGQVMEIVVIPSSVVTDFSSYLSQIYDSNPDVIMNAMLLPELAANQINAASEVLFDGFYLFPDTIAGKSEFVNNLVNVFQVDGARGASSGFGIENSIESQFFNESFYQQFSLAPQTFNVTAYDYVMVVALAIEQAGMDFNTSNPNGEQIRSSLRKVMNTPGVKIGPSRIAEALSLIRQGIDIDYSGAYADTDWDVNGDIFGDVPYNLFILDAQVGDFVVSGQVVVTVPAGD